jgi:hypothetical protein
VLEIVEKTEKNFLSNFLLDRPARAQKAKANSDQKYSKIVELKIDLNHKIISE